MTGRLVATGPMICLCQHWGSKGTRQRPEAVSRPVEKEMDQELVEREVHEFCGRQ